MSYELQYPMLLPVEGMTDGDGVDFTAEKAAAALRAMADRVEANPEKLREIFGRAPVVAEREDRWVLRSATIPNVIRKAAGGWVSVDPGDIDLEDTLASKYIAEHNLDPGKDGLWVRPENIGGLPVLAALRPGNGVFAGQIDLRDWLAWADEDVTEAVIAANWDFTGVLADSLSDSEDPAFDDPNLARLDALGDNYSAMVEQDEIPRAIAYLDELRPGFIDRIGARPSEDAGIEP